MRYDYSKEIYDSAVKANELIQSLIAETEKAVVGRRSEITMLVCALLSGGHVLIEDVPGTGKTTLVKALSKAAGLKFNRTQFTPDVMASDITGYNIYNRGKEQFEFREGAVMCNVLLADEINRASPKTQSALLEAMEENGVTVDGKTYEIPSPFCVIATQNPTGYVGTYPLPEAQLDRFSIRLSMGYPTENEEINIITNRKECDPLDSICPVTDCITIKKLSKVLEAVEVSEEISKYIVELVGATRKTSKLSLGASPRASLALMRLCRALAFIKGRDYVLAEDVAAMFYPCVSHRVILSQEARIDRLTVSDVLSSLTKEIQVPYRGAR